MGLIIGLGRIPGRGNDNSPQHSCLENPTDRGAWRATVYGVAKTQTRPSIHAHTHTHTHTQIKFDMETIISENPGLPFCVIVIYYATMCEQ